MAFIVHPDANRIALFHERRFRLALQDRLDRAHLGKATVAEPALGDRLARAAVRIAVRHGARSDDRSRTQIPCLRRMGDELAEVEGHVDRSEEHTSELQSLMRRPYDGFCLKKKNK